MSTETIAIATPAQAQAPAQTFLVCCTNDGEISWVTESLTLDDATNALAHIQEQGNANIDRSEGEAVFIIPIMGFHMFKKAN